MYNITLIQKTKKTADCVVRALSKATGKDYKVVYKELFELSLKTGFILNDKRNYEKYLTENGFIKYKQPRYDDNTKYTIGELDRVCKGTIIVSCANHLTCVVDNVLYDIWDCRNKCISNYYKKGGVR